MENIDPFITAYRDSLKEVEDTNIAANEQARSNQYQQFMEGANAAGMLYSNFPERQKIQYTGSTYLPNAQKIFNNYYTGIQSLRETGSNIANQIKSYQQAIAELSGL